MKKNSIIAALATVICLGAMAGLTGCQKVQDKSKNVKVQPGLEDERLKSKPKPRPKSDERITVEGTADKEDPYMKNTVDFARIREINPDAYAWIKIPDTAVNYPILQSTSQPDSYYLKRTINLYVGYPGSIYTEKYNSRDFMDPVTVVYGHNMRDGSMFAALHKYRDAGFLAEHPYFYIYLPDKTLKYRIFSAAAFNDNHILKNYNFKNDEEVLNFYNDLMSRKTGNTDKTVKVTKESRILTMSTCIGSRPDQRWLVSGVLIYEEKCNKEGNVSVRF